MAKAKKTSNKRGLISAHLLHGKWLALLFIVIFGVTGAAFVYFTKAASQPYNMYRLTNGTYRYYTTNMQEKDFIISLGWRVESTTPFTNPTSSAPIHVYKLQNTSNGNAWYYTTNITEYGNLSKSGWTGKGIAFLAASSPAPAAGYCRQPWTKLQNKATPARYLYTPVISERDSAINSGAWTNQGIAFSLDYTCSTTIETPLSSPTPPPVTNNPTTTNVTPPAPTTTDTSGCSSTSHKKADGSYWTCTFSDEFNGNALDTNKWLVMETAKTGYKSGDYGCMVNSPNNVNVSNGVLNLVARKEAAPFPCNRLNSSNTAQYTAATINTYGDGRFSQLYGRFEVRARILGATAKGLQTAFWMMPVNGNKYYSEARGYAWPTSGEIDIAEVYSTYPDRAIPYLHYLYDPATTNTKTSTNVATNNYCLISDITKFHTYTVEWNSQAITIIYDGKVCMINRWQANSGLTGRQPFDQPFYVVLSQLLGVPNNGNGFEPGKTPLPATTQVDYVRAWK